MHHERTVDDPRSDVSDGPKRSVALLLLILRKLDGMPCYWPLPDRISGRNHVRNPMAGRNAQIWKTVAMLV